MATRVTEGARRRGEKITLHGKVFFFYGVEVKVYFDFLSSQPDITTAGDVFWVNSVFLQEA